MSSPDRDVEALLGPAFSRAPIGMAITASRDGRPAVVRAMNRAYAEFLGYRPEQLIGRPITVFTPDWDVDGDTEMHQRLQAGEALRLSREKRYLRADGTLVWGLLSLSLMPFDDGTAMLATVLDISQQKALEAELRAAATKDPLTRASNRASLREALRTADDEGRQVALVLIDIDDLAGINAEHGDAVGDQVLKQTASRLAGLVAAQDVIARIGDDEFAVLHHLTRPDSATSLAARLHSDVFGRRIVDGEPVMVDATIAIAYQHPGEGPVEQVLSDVDTALRHAKQLRGGQQHTRVQVYDDELREAVEERESVRKELRSALADGRIEVRYQPLVSAGRHPPRLRAVEAMARLRTDDGELLLPHVFLPAAADGDLLPALGRTVRQIALADWAWMQASLPDPLGMAVNVDPDELGEPDFMSGLLLVMERVGMPPDELFIELTENRQLEEGTVAAAVLLPLRQAGVHVVCDDFGAGYASLRYLARLPIDGLKLDRGYIANFAHSAVDRGIARAVAALAAELDVLAVAEGIETDAELEAVQDLGYDLYQGFLFGRPVRREEIVASWA